MKKIISLLIVLVLLLSCFSFSYADQDGIGIYIDGQKLTTTAEPVNMEGNIMVPMRDIFEAMGATVEWIPGDTSRIIARKGLKLVEMLVSDGPHRYIFVNGKEIDIPEGPILSDGHTLVPARAVAEALDATVEWKGGNVIITTNKIDYSQYYMEFPSVPDMGKMFNVTAAGKSFNAKDNLTDKDSRSLVIYQYNLKDLPSDYLERYKATLKEKGFVESKNVVQSGVTTDFYIDANSWFLVGISHGNGTALISMSSNVNLVNFDKTTGEYLSIFSTNFVPSYSHISNQMAFSVTEDDANTRTYFYIYNEENVLKYIQKLLDDGFVLKDPSGTTYIKDNISVDLGYPGNSDGLYIQIKKLEATN